MIERHHLAGRHLDSLAIDVDDAEAVALLQSAQHSKRALLLRAVMDTAARVYPGAYRSSGVEHAFTVLAQADQASPDVVEKLLLHPQVGGWATATVRHLRERRNSTPAVTYHLRHLGAIAASAAILADQDFAVSVPVNDGRVVLPMLGAVELGPITQITAEVGRSGRGTTVTAGTTTVLLPSDLNADAPGWRTVRRLSTVANGKRWDVALDDLDPYRDYPGLMPTDALADDTVDRWQTRLRAAWQLLAVHHPDLAGSVSIGLSSIVPLQAPETRAVSGTSSATIGAAAVSLPDEVTDLAVTLVHELQHSKLGALIDLLPLQEESVDLYYAPWRDDPRPLGGLLHGCYAYFAITQFWRRQRYVETGPDSDRAHFEFARWREVTWRTTRVLEDSGHLTAPGRRLVAGMRATLERWMHDPVPSVPHRTARIAGLDHWVMWRLRNLHVDAEWAAQCARAWLAGLPCPDEEPAPVTVVAGTVPPPESARLPLIRHLLRHQEQPSPLASAADLAALDGDAHPADALLVWGDHTAAADGYRACLPRDLTDPTAWSGLSVALALALDNGDACLRALVHAPEVVRAVYGEIVAVAGTAPDLDSVVRWLAPTFGSATPTPVGCPPFGHIDGGSMPKSILVP